MEPDKKKGITFVKNGVMKQKEKKENFTVEWCDKGSIKEEEKKM